MIHEKRASAVAGIPMLLFDVVVFVAALVGFIQFARAHDTMPMLASLAVLIVASVVMFGFTIVNPNEAQVVTLFGKYTGSVRDPGLWWLNPFTVRKRVSLRVRNFESSKLKVNDQDGNIVPGSIKPT